MYKLTIICYEGAKRRASVFPRLLLEGNRHEASIALKSLFF